LERAGDGASSFFIGLENSKLYLSGIRSFEKANSSSGSHFLSLSRIQNGFANIQALVKRINGQGNWTNTFNRPP